MDVPKLYPLYHIETQKQDGTWVRFTLDPLPGLEAAEAHLVQVRHFMVERGESPERVRLREVRVVRLLVSLTCVCGVVTEGIEVALLRGGAAFVGCPACGESFSVGYPQEAPVGVSWAGPVGVPLREG